jgi:hypothetical protein
VTALRELPQHGLEVAEIRIVASEKQDLHAIVTALRPVTHSTGENSAQRR